MTNPVSQKSPEEKLNKFIQLEKEYNLFDKKTNDVLIWERIRGKVFAKILSPKKEFETSNSKNKITDDMIKGFRLLKNTMFKNPYLSTSFDLIYFGGGRRFRHCDGVWWDIYLDPVIDHVTLEHVFLEKPFRSQHFTPAKTDNIKHTDIITNLPKVVNKIYGNKVNITRENAEFFQIIEEEIKEQFDTDVDVSQMIERELFNRKVKYPQYRKVINKIDPSAVVLAWTDDHLVEACKDEGITTIKMQKGHRHKYFLKYSFPEEFMHKEVFPDYKLVWGQYWKDEISYPLDQNKIIPVGFPYLEQKKKDNDDNNEENRVVFISARSYGTELSKVAAELDQQTKYDIFYKLHPGQEQEWQKIYPWLSSSNVNVISHDNANIYDLFTKSSIQVGVNSSAILEGLYFGLDTYILNVEPYVCIFKDIISEFDIPVVENSEQLASKIVENQTLDIDIDYLFADNATKKTVETIHSIIKDNTGP